MKKYTPEFILALLPNEYFVFGSNLNGNHAGGAARTAAGKFSAEWGVGEGITGRCYALPTLDENMQKVTPTALRRSFEKLWGVALDNPEKIFLVTKVGCGIAGWTIEEVKNILWASVGSIGDLPPNVVLPKEFCRERRKYKQREISPVVDCQECEWVTRSLGFGTVLWTRIKHCHTYKITPSLALLLADVIKSFGESTMYCNYMQYITHRDRLPVIGFKEFTENVFPNCVYPSTGLWQELWGLQKLPIGKRVEMSGFAESEIRLSPDNMLDYPDCLMESIKSIEK